MKGLEVSEVRLTELKNENVKFRIDDEYFNKKYINAERKIRGIGCVRFSSIINVLTDFHSNGSYESIAKEFQLFDSPNYAYMVRTTDLESENYTDNVKYINERCYNYLAKSKVYGGELLINKIGTPGRTYLMPHLNRPISLGMNLFLIRLNKKNGFNESFLWVYFNTTIGKNIIYRKVNGTVPLTIDKESIKSLIIPKIAQNIQLLVERKVRLSQSKSEESKKIYTAAEEQLLSELGLKDWQPQNKNINVKTLKESFLSSGRLDAEFYQSKYDEIENKIKATKFDTLDNLCLLVNHGMQPPYVENGEMRVFSQKWIKDKEIDYSFIEDKDEPRTNIEFAQRNSAYVCRKNDIVHYSVGANIGFCHTYLSDVPMMPGSFITLIRADENKINPIYLGIVLNSVVGRIQSEKRKSGTAQPYVYPKDIKEFFIPILSQHIQEQIASKVQKSFTLKKESKSLLEQAKTMVENEIEKGGE